MTDTEIAQKEREIVIARLELISSDLYFSDGGDDAAYTRDDMIKLIKEGDPKGIEFVKTEWEFLRALKSGEVVRAIS